MTRKPTMTFEEAMDWYYNKLDELDGELFAIEKRATEELTLDERYQLSIRRSHLLREIKKTEEAQARMTAALKKIGMAA